MMLPNQGKLKFGTVWTGWSSSLKKRLGKAARSCTQFYRTRRLLVQVLSFLFLLVVGWVITIQPWFRERTGPLRVEEAEGGLTKPLTEIVFELQKDLSELRKQIPDPPAPQSTVEEISFLSLKLIPPVQGEVVRRSNWEKRYTEWRYHPGIDLTVPAGTGVLACAAGIVKEIKTDPTLGTVVLIDHGQEWNSLYAYLTAVQVAPGQKVGPGMVLGYASSSTCGPEPGVHFELHYQNKSVDPLTMMEIRQD